MTDNIQKLYEIAGVEKQLDCKHYMRGGSDYNDECEICKGQDYFKDVCDKGFNRGKTAQDRIKCPYCEIEDYGYPPFTAEKQLELIKWLLRHKQTTQVELRFFENDYCISHCTEHEENDAVEYVRTGSEKQFEQAIADLFNDMWQDLTDEQKQEIKEILQ